MTQQLITDRLILRPWHISVAVPAHGVYGHPDVARWLSPAMGQVTDLVAMRHLLRQWITEADQLTHAVVEWAFRHDVGEIFAVVRSGNVRAVATVRRNGMEWVGETTKYYGLNLQVFRLRRADYNPAAAMALLPPSTPR